MIVSLNSEQDNVKEEIKDKIWYEEEEKREELKYEKRSYNMFYKILKRNPLDAINDVYRKVIDKLNLEEIEQEWQWWAAYVWCNESLRRLFNIRVENVYGDLFPEYGGGIIVSNHESHFDPFFVGGTCQRRIHWMSKLGNFKTPIVRTLFRNLGAFKLDRDNPAEAWEIAKQRIEEGGWVGIFPEGTRSEDGTMGEFKTGAVRLATELGVPIVPMAVIGSRNVLPKGQLVVKPTQVTIRVGRPIYYDQYKEKMNYELAKKMSAELRIKVIKLFDDTYFVEDVNRVKHYTKGTYINMEEASKADGFMGRLKSFGFGFIQIIDDTWYAVLRSIEKLGLKSKLEKFLYNVSGNVIHEFSKISSPYKVIDYDKYVPKEGGAVICANHNSYWDIAVLSTSLEQLKIYIYQMIDEYLFIIPLVNSWLRSTRAFPYKKGAPSEKGYDYAKELLQEGKKVVVYPEGVLNEGGGNLLPGSTEAIRIAIETKVPIIPIGITGTENILPPGTKKINFGKSCILKAGEHFVDHQEYWDKTMPNEDILQQLTNNLMDKIKNLLMYSDLEV